MKNLLKGAFVAGALAVSVTAFADNAEAAPATASWYGPGFACNLTANGEVFNPQAMTAAHKTLPFGTQVEVCYNGCTTVTINDRGPYANGAQYDLSQGAAQAIGMTGVQTIDATVGGSGNASAPAPEPTPEAAPASGQAELNAVPAATQAQPASTGGDSYGESHTVQSGDTLFSIAQQHGVSVDEIAAADDISNVSLIFPGQEFSIPGGASA